MITALDPQGVICGVTVMIVEGQYGALACYGDDPDTPADEGAAQGDRIRLVVAGQITGSGVWTSRGERQKAPLGKAEEPVEPPAEPPTMRTWLPLILNAGQD